MDVVTRTPWEFTPKHYDDLPEEKRPVYTLRPMSARDRATYDDLIQVDDNGKAIIRYGTLRYEYLRRVVAGAKIPGIGEFQADGLLDWDQHVELIPEADVREICMEVKTRTEPREEDEEKS